MIRLSKRAVILALIIMLGSGAWFLRLSAPSFADSAASITSAEFVIGMSQYFVNDQVPGVSMDAAPYIDSASGRTLVPVRYLADALGAQIAWDGTIQTVTVTGGNTNIDMTIGSTTLTGGGQASQMDVSPVINNGRTYLPARWVANALGYQVDWNAAYQIVIIWPNGTTEPDYSNVIGQAQQKPTVFNGFTIPAGTNLTVDTTAPTGPGYALIDFQIDGSKGDVQGQIADAQNILSQTQYLDSATVAQAMTVINDLTTIQNPVMSDNGLFNSPNGGSVEVHSEAFVMNKGYCWIDVQIDPQHPSSSPLPTK